LVEGVYAVSSPHQDQIVTKIYSAFLEPEVYFGLKIIKDRAGRGDLGLLKG
jgi:hypothetical protein